MKGRFLYSLIITLIVIVLSAVFARLTFAESEISYTPTEPTYPSCFEPQGELKVSYESGIHGIPGNQNTFFGSDAVNILSNSTLIQCFCPDEGDEGIQTNWWKADQLSMNEIEILKKLGWVYVPNGEAWGLDQSPYLAKNADYVCKGRGGNDDGDDDKDSSDDDNDKHDAPDEILGLSLLPKTGNLTEIAIYLSVCIMSLLGMFLLRDKKS